MHFGQKGSVSRDGLDKGYEAFRLGAMIQNARLEKGITQEQLAQRLEQQNPKFQNWKTT
jgi:ribosome-binding protein aMBF1 (putative translation factor)